MNKAFLFIYRHERVGKSSGFIFNVFGGDVFLYKKRQPEKISKC